VGCAIDIAVRRFATPTGIDLIPRDASHRPTRNFGARFGALGEDSEVSIEHPLVKIDIERHEALCFGHCAGGQRLLQLHPHVAGWSSGTGELLAGRLAPREYRRWNSGRCHSHANIDRPISKVELYRYPRVEPDLVRTHPKITAVRSAQLGASARIAEAAAEGDRLRRIEEGDVGAYDRLTCGGFDDFDAHVLRAGANAGCQNCRS